MIGKILLWFSNYFRILIFYVFWLYFLFIIIYNVLGYEIGKIPAYIFWLILGLYWGYNLALQIINYKNKFHNKM